MARAKGLSEEEVVLAFMSLNKVEAGWQTFIMSRERIWKSLVNSIDNLEKLPATAYLPCKDQVLAAFRYCPWSRIRVILLGYDPIPKRDFATGLAFSYPLGVVEDHSQDSSNSAVKKIHAVLRRVRGQTDGGFLPSSVTSCCHISWARQGALLLNSVLTVTPFSGPQYRQVHKDIWIDFVKVLLEELLYVKKSEIVVVFWGTHAEEIYRYLNRHTFFIGDHPTFTSNDYPETLPYTVQDSFHAQAFRQFQYIARKWPDMFRLCTVDQDVEEELGPSAR